MSLFFNSIGTIIQNFLRKALTYKTKLVFEFFEAVEYKNTFRKSVNIYETVSLLIQHYYFQGQYYTRSFLELHILVLFLTSDRASCTVASSALFTNTPKLQLLVLPAYLAIAKRRVILITQQGHFLKHYMHYIILQTGFVILPPFNNYMEQEGLVTSISIPTKGQKSPSIVRQHT